MRSIESLKCKTGTKMMIANDSVKDGNFGIVPLSSNHRHVSIDANALIDKLLDAMRDRLFATNAAGQFEPVMPTTSFLTKFASFILPIGQDLDFNYGEEEYGHCASQEVLQCLHSKTMLTVKGDEFLMIFSPY